MTLNEIETLIIELQKQVAANTAAIVTLNNTVSNYATTDDLEALSDKIDILQDNNLSLSSDLSSLYNAITKIDHLGKLLDVEIISPLTEGDVLQYSNTGKWSNVKVDQLTPTAPASSVNSLNDLADVQLTGLTNNHVLMYDSGLGKWTNHKIDTGMDGFDLTNYLTKTEAALLYLPLAGGTISGSLLVKGFTTIDNDLLVSGGITMYNN